MKNTQDHKNIQKIKNNLWNTILIVVFHLDQEVRIISFPKFSSFH